MKKALLAVAALCCLGSAALAGPNAGGTLIAAVSVGTVYTTDQADYCGSSTTTDCGSAVTRHDGTDPVVFNVLAAFPGAGGRLMGLTWGVTYTPGVILSAWGMCGNFELPTGDWPASGSGNAVTWASPQTDPLVEVYWFAAYSYYGGPETFTLGPHPTQGGDFGDDAVPSNIDPIAGFGTLGFGADGHAPCPGAAPGACCFEDGSCLVLLAEECAAAGGIFAGEGVTCEEANCPQPAVGACCFGEECVLLTQDECDRNGGVYKGDESVCDPNPCIVIPTIEASWGSIKNIYR